MAREPATLLPEGRRRGSPEGCNRAKGAPGTPLREGAAPLLGEECRACHDPPRREGPHPYEGETDGPRGRPGDRRPAHGGTAERGAAGVPWRSRPDSPFPASGVPEHRLAAHDPREPQELRRGGFPHCPGADLFLGERKALPRVAGHPGRGPVGVDGHLRGLQLCDGRNLRKPARNRHESHLLLDRGRGHVRPPRRPGRRDLRGPARRWNGRRAGGDLRHRPCHGAGQDNLPSDLGPVRGRTFLPAPCAAIAAQGEQGQGRVPPCPDGQGDARVQPEPRRADSRPRHPRVRLHAAETCGRHGPHTERAQLRGPRDPGGRRMSASPEPVRLKSLTMADLQRLCEAAVLSEGVSIYDGKLLANPARSGRRIYAEVKGTAETAYAVVIDLKGDGRDLEKVRCTCPSAKFRQGGMCKHQAAVLVAWSSTPGSFVEVPESTIEAKEGERRRKKRATPKRGKADSTELIQRGRATLETLLAELAHTGLSTLTSERVNQVRELAQNLRALQLRR